MADNATLDWDIPVGFYFLVDFQKYGKHFQVSFMEVSGLDIKLETKKHSNDTDIWIKMPSKMEYGNITLKRHVARLKDDTFTQWVNTCLKADKDKEEYIKPYDMIIKLLNKDGEPLESWNCSYSYPVRWSLSGLNAEKSELAVETVVMTCNRIERVTMFM